MLKNRSWSPRWSFRRLIILGAIAGMPMAAAFGQKPPEANQKPLEVQKQAPQPAVEQRAAKHFATIAPGEPLGISVEKADLMGRVEWAMMHSGRDITARKTIEWGDVEKDANGNRKIRYKFYATVWDKDVYIVNRVFTFDAKGNILDVENITGFPQKKVAKPADVNTQAGMKDLVEDFFSKNFRDLTSRETIEWGEVTKAADGNASIRYKYRAKIWDKDTKIMNQVFTFDPKGNLVSVKDVEAPQPALLDKPAVAPARSPAKGHGQ